MSRWLGLFGPLLLVVAADQIVNREWHSATWTSVGHSPEFYEWMGIGALIFGMVLMVAGLTIWSNLEWFH